LSVFDALWQKMLANLNSYIFLILTQLCDIRELS